MKQLGACTWAFKVEYYQKSLLRKMKDRFFVRKDMQIEGVDFFDAFSRVFQWTIVQLMLMISQQLSLATS